VRVLYLIGIGAWLLIADFLLVGALGHRFPRPLGTAGSWVLIAVSAAALAAIGLRRVARNREQARLVYLQQTALQALAALTDPSLAKLPADQLLDEMLTRLVAALNVETAAVYLIQGDQSELVARAAVGALSDTPSLPADHGPAAEIIGMRAPLQEPAPNMAGLMSLAGCPIVIEDRLIGVCLVGSTASKAFNEADTQLLQLVADRVSAGIEWSRLDEAERRSRMAAERARQHVTLLARASEVLTTAIDKYEPVLAALVDVVVPDFADWCGIDVVEPGGSRRPLAARQTAERAASPGLSKNLSSLEDLADAAARVGTTQQLSRTPEPASDGGVAVPIRVRQRTFGLITLAVDPGRADYEPSDVAVLEQLAGRASLTIERVLLYGELRAREAQWRSLVEATPAGILEVDLAGQILVWNRFAADMFGWDGASAPAFAPETTDALTVLWAQAAEGEEIVDNLVSAVVAKGERRDLAISVAPLRPAAGAVEGVLTLAVDVTERRRLQAGLQAAQRTEALGQVAGAIAHDFNNLLTLISGYTELLRRREALDDQDKRQLYLDEIRKATEKASMLTGQLLTIGHRQVAKPVVLAPRQAVEAIREVLPRILGVDITLECKLDDSAGNVRIDPGQLEQLLLNLAINARDAMPDGGQLTISVVDASLSFLAAAELGMHADRAVQISVADTGVGMNEETCRRCLEPFFTTKDRSKGTGLGLAAVKGIVDEAGGAIEVESQPGVGTAFTIYLPAVDEEPTIEAPVPPPQGGGGSETVLVVDDESDIRQIIWTVLDHDGYQVLEAANGGEAVSIAEHWDGPIDLLVTDVMMPKMHGVDVAAAVKALRPQIEVLLISGYTDDAKFSVDAAADPLTFLAKPFNPSELADRVRAILDRG
jgi:PAS domain S-box-containing protein